VIYLLLSLLSLLSRISRFGRFNSRFVLISLHYENYCTISTAYPSLLFRYFAPVTGQLQWQHRAEVRQRAATLPYPTRSTWSLLFLEGCDLTVPLHRQPVNAVSAFFGSAGCGHGYSLPYRSDSNLAPMRACARIRPRGTLRTAMLRCLPHQSTFKPNFANRSSHCLTARSVTLTRCGSAGSLRGRGFTRRAADERILRLRADCYPWRFGGCPQPRLDPDRASGDLVGRCPARRDRGWDPARPVMRVVRPSKGGTIARSDRGQAWQPRRFARSRGRTRA